MTDLASMRIDKWLWCARFYKTRSLAVDEIGKGRIRVHGVVIKPAREVRVGDCIVLRQAGIERTVIVRGLSNLRGPAPVAQTLYEETPDSLAERSRQAEQQRLAPEPANAIAALHTGRPTKRERRQLDRQREPGSPASHSWNDRWSASIDP